MKKINKQIKINIVPPGALVRDLYFYWSNHSDFKNIEATLHLVIPESLLKDKNFKISIDGNATKKLGKYMLCNSPEFLRMVGCKSMFDSD